MKFRNKTITVISLVIFIVSLFFNAFKTKDLGQIKNYTSIELLLVGPIAFLGGGIFEFFVWTANGWFLLSALFIFTKKYLNSLLVGLIASCISGSFIFWREILAAENGRMAEIYSLEIGYFLWFISILFITFSSIYLKIKDK